MDFTDRYMKKMKNRSRRRRRRGRRRRRRSRRQATIQLFLDKSLHKLDWLQKMLSPVSLLHHTVSVLLVLFILMTEFLFQFILPLYRQPSSELFYIKIKIIYLPITLDTLFIYSSLCMQYCVCNFTVHYY